MQLIILIVQSFFELSFSKVEFAKFLKFLDSRLEI
jgi:hypothetical protein